MSASCFTSRPALGPTSVTCGTKQWGLSCVGPGGGKLAGATTCCFAMNPFQDALRKRRLSKSVERRVPSWAWRSRQMSRSGKLKLQEVAVVKRSILMQGDLLLVQAIGDGAVSDTLGDNCPLASSTSESLQARAQLGARVRFTSTDTRW